MKCLACKTAELEHNQATDAWRCPECKRWFAKEAIAEIERLRDIVATLPVTADGVSVTAGMRHWTIMDGIARVRCPDVRWSDLDDDTYDWSRVYSTREAAEAAKEQADG